MKVLFAPKELSHGKVIGGPILVYNRIKYLAKLGHHVGLVSYAREEDHQYLDTLEPYVQEMELMPYPPPRGMFKRVKDFFFSNEPPYFCNTRSTRMKETLGRMCKDSRYDAVIAEYTVMGQFIYQNPLIPETTKRIASCHECYTRARRMSLELHGRFSRTGLIETVRLKGLEQYEFAMYRDVDLVLTLTPEEKDGLIQMDPGLKDHVEVVPHGVDIGEFAPVPEEQKEKSIMFLGNYPHYPNADAVYWFYEEGWPLLKEKHPDLKWFIVGRGPTPEIREMARKDPKIVVTGKVNEVKPWFDKSLIFIAPIRLGKGFRGKVLEAMACGLPVVSSSLGVEGSNGQDREHFLLAEEPKAVARGVLELLEKPDLRRKIAQGGRDLVVKDFSWQHGVEILESVLKKLTGKD